MGTRLFGSTLRGRFVSLPLSAWKPRVSTRNCASDLIAYAQHVGHIGARGAARKGMLRATTVLLQRLGRHPARNQPHDLHSAVAAEALQVRRTPPLSVRASSRQTPKWRSTHLIRAHPSASSCVPRNSKACATPTHWRTRPNVRTDLVLMAITIAGR